MKNRLGMLSTWRTFLWECQAHVQCLGEVWVSSPGASEVYCGLWWGAGGIAEPLGGQEMQGEPTPTPHSIAHAPQPLACRKQMEIAAPTQGAAWMQG